MAQPRYYDLSGKEVFFYHPVDALESLELGAVTVGAPEAAPAPKKEEAPAPVVEEVKEEAPAEAVEEAPKKRAPRRRASA